MAPATTTQESTTMNAKTITIATYPDGTRFQIHKTQGSGWIYADDRQATPLRYAIELAEADGAVISTEPNPYYRKPVPKQVAPLDALTQFRGWVS
jgi:hypothetical protein